MSAVHLGLDVGGTASRWLACDASGAVKARGSVGGATAHVFNPAERARLTQVFEAIAVALGQLGLLPMTLCAGMTGFGAPASGEIKTIATAALGISPQAVTIVDDILLAYAAHFEPGAGHLVAAGTGSIGIHVTATGDVVRVGGRGILIDDAGSGSWIARQALDLIYRSHDRTGSFGEVAILAGELLALIGGESWSDVRSYVYGGDRGRIGTLAVAVARAAEAGDRQALDILRLAGAELARLGEALCQRAGAGEVALIGGVLQLHPVIAETVAERLPGIAITRPAVDSPLAAARLTSGRGVWKSLFDQGLATP